MFTRFRAAAFAALLLIISISPVMAHTYSPSHYAAPCSSGSNTYHPFFNVLRPIGFKADDHTTYGAYKSMQATATITDLDPCTSATSSDNGWDLINVVNGETMAYGANAYAFVQFGYAQQACVTGSCQDTFSPYGTDFWWTVADDNNGGVARADWIDFTGAGHSAGGRPVLGDRYQFTVNWIASPQQWQFCIKVNLAAHTPSAQRSATPLLATVRHPQPRLLGRRKLQRCRRPRYRRWRRHRHLADAVHER